MQDPAWVEAPTESGYMSAAVSKDDSSPALQGRKFIDSLRWTIGRWSRASVITKQATTSRQLKGKDRNLLQGDAKSREPGHLATRLSYLLRNIPTAPAATITTGSGTFLVQVRMANVTTAMRTVGKSMSERRARM